MLLFLGIPLTIVHLSQTRGGEWVSNGEPVFITRFTIGNHGKDENNYYRDSDMNLVLILNSCFLVVLIFISMLLKTQQESIIQRVDDKLITPSDFTIMVYNIPKDKTSNELKQWLEDHHWGSDILSVSYCYDIRQMISL